MGTRYIRGEKRDQLLVQNTGIVLCITVGSIPVHGVRQSAKLLPIGSKQKLLNIIGQGMHLLQQMSSRRKIIVPFHKSHQNLFQPFGRTLRHHRAKLIEKIAGKPGLQLSLSLEIFQQVIRRIHAHGHQKPLYQRTYLCLLCPQKPGHIAKQQALHHPC